MKKRVFGLLIATFAFMLHGEINAYVFGQVLQKNPANAVQVLQGLAKDKRKALKNNLEATITIKITPISGLGTGRWSAVVYDCNAKRVAVSQPIDRASASPFELTIENATF